MAESLVTAATRSPQRLRVLVVDDHDVVHWGFRLMLTQQPWVERCVAASNGDEAVELARRYRPHVAVVDLFIGEESGAQVCERLREAEPATRVLLFSGAGEISAERRAGGRRLRLRLQGLAGGEDRRRGPARRPGRDRVRAPGPLGVAGPVRARARGSAT